MFIVSHLIQRPTQWLAKALGIVSGQVPQQLDPQLVAVVDASQGGWGFPSYDVPVKAYGQTVLAAGWVTLLTENTKQDEIRLWFGSCTNNEVVGVSIQLGLFREGRFVVVAPGSVLAAGGLRDASALLGPNNPRWLVVPPGWGVAAFFGAIIGAGVAFNMGVGIFPAGTKPF